MTDAEYGERQAQAIERCVTALLADSVGEHDQALTAIRALEDTTLGMATFFDMLRQVFVRLPLDEKEHHLDKWEQDSLELRTLA
jgi:hypothetical protein